MDSRYGIANEYQGLAYAYEAAKASLDFVFSTERLEKVNGVSVIDNIASVKLLEKLGMKETHENLYDTNELISMRVNKLDV